MQSLTKTKLPYLKGKQPETALDGKTIYVHALEVEFNWSTKLWQQTNQLIDQKIDRKNCQIAVFTPYHDDVTHSLLKSLRLDPLGKYPVATSIEQQFPDNEIKIIMDNEAASAGHVYLVAPILTERDFSRVRKIADHYKNTLNIPFVTLVCPFLGYTREDKNVTSKGEYEPSVTSIRAEIGGLSPFVDRMIVIEPHSSATQAYAAMFGIPLAPISPWKIMVEELSKKIEINTGNTVVIRPDKGRNLAATRIGEFLKIPFASFDKVRVSGQAVTLFELSEKEKETVKDKHCLIYDDEASTMGTVYALAEALMGYGAKSLAVCLVHCKFTPGWESRIKHPLFSVVLGTDSRQPIGNINIADNIELVSLKPLLRRIITADIKGVNFWKDSEFKEMLLQE